MSQQKLLREVIETLDRAGIEYMITGSVVSSLQGEPRSTHDIDMVIAIDKSRVPALAEAFKGPRFYLSEQSILDAIDNLGMFNLIEPATGDKVDFWLLGDDAFDRSRFLRRYNEEFMGIQMRLSTPEDTILAKLRWAKLSGGSEKQFTDALRVYEVQYEKLDLDYLRRWTKELDVEILWKRLTSEAETA
jgi:hypothetical protein